MNIARPSSIFNTGIPASLISTARPSSIIHTSKPTCIKYTAKPSSNDSLEKVFVHWSKESGGRKGVERWLLGQVASTRQDRHRKVAAGASGLYKAG